MVAFILDAFQSLLPTFKAKDEKEEARLKRIEEGGATDEDDEDDDDNKLQTLVYIQRLEENFNMTLAFSRTQAYTWEGGGGCVILGWRTHGAFTVCY